jgi:hypothetical protein
VSSLASPAPAAGVAPAPLHRMRPPTSRPSNTARHASFIVPGCLPGAMVGDRHPGRSHRRVCRNRPCPSMRHAGDRGSRHPSWRPVAAHPVGIHPGGISAGPVVRLRGSVSCRCRSTGVRCVPQPRPAPDA